MGGASQAELAARGGPSVSVLSKIETGARAYGDRVITKLEDVLGWERGSVQAILDGGEAQLKASAPPPAGAVYPEVVGDDPFFRYIWDYPGAEVGREEREYVVLRAKLRRLELGKQHGVRPAADPPQRRVDQG
ncbi:helix-turn-helix domain-containing protein [Spirillospora sp. CA-128828]|uniref:helix-turn-helix domain-containing protein n=1 Tax=Spirillospora sp. CA-128828 TaxID=3240033 RepID=UPI003D92F159